MTKQAELEAELAAVEAELDVAQAHLKEIDARVEAATLLQAESTAALDAAVRALSDEIGDISIEELVKVGILSAQVAMKVRLFRARLAA